MLTFPCLSTNNISSPAYVSPNTFPTQTPSYIMTIQEHKLPHQYRPFRVPAPKQRSAQELLSGLLTLGSDAIPKGSFLPSHTRKESKGVVGKYRDSRGRWYGERIDRQIPNTFTNGVVVDVDVEVHEEIAGEYVKVNYGPESPLPPPLPPKSTVYGRQATRAGGSCKAIVRRRDTIKAAQAALARGTSCSSTASTIKAVPVPVPVPTIKSKKQVPAQLDVVSANSKRAGSPVTLSSDDGDAPRTPTNGDLLDLPVVQVEAAPPTPLNVPPTPLDIPVDWDDLRERWTIGDYYQASLSHHDELVEEEDAVEEKSVIIPPEVASPVHAYAGAKHSKDVTELNLSFMTSKDLGQYFLDPQHVTLDGQATSSLLAPPDWAATRSKARGGAAQTGTFNEAGSRKSVIVFNPDSLRSTLIIDEFPSPPGSSTSTPTLSSSTTQTTTTPIKSTNIPGSKRKMPSFVFPPPALPPPTDALPALPNSTTQPNQRPSAMAALKPLVTTGINGSRPGAASSSSAYPPVAKKKGGKRHGRLVSLDEAELVLRTVRFSTTLDPQFDYTKFKQNRADSREASLICESALVLSPVSTIGPDEEGKNAVQEVIAGESFLSVVSPLSPMNRRWSQSAF